MSILCFLKFRNNVENKLKNLQLDLITTNDQLDCANDEIDALKKQLVKAHDELKVTRERSDRELYAKTEEAEDVK